MRDDQIDLTRVLRPGPLDNFSPPTLSNHDHIRCLIHQAIILHGRQESGAFTSASFAKAVAQQFAVKVPGADWVESVLGKEEGLCKMPGAGGHWRKQAG